MSPRKLFLEYAFVIFAQLPDAGRAQCMLQMWAPVDHLLGVLMNMLSRRNEFQADAYAVGLGYAKGLQSGLVKLQLENLGNMVR